MTDEELRTLVANTAQLANRNAQAIEQLQQSSADFDRKLQQSSADFDRKLNGWAERAEQRTQSLDRQLSLLADQVQAMADTQVGNSNRLTSAERNIQGIYDILRVYAQEQEARSRLIDQQIQALIDERRRS